MVIYYLQIIIADIKLNILGRIGKSTEFRISIIELYLNSRIVMVVLNYDHLILIIINYLQKIFTLGLIVLSRCEYKQKNFIILKYQ